MANQLSSGSQSNRRIAPGLLLPITKDSQRALIRGEGSTPSRQAIEGPIAELKDPLPAHDPDTPELTARAFQILGEELRKSLHRSLQRLSVEIANRQRQLPPADMRRK
jgi:hypothetical protein